VPEIKWVVSLTLEWVVSYGTCSTFDPCLPCLQTAERVLPAVFALLEAAVEVLAADADRGASTSIDDEEAPRLPASCACFQTRQRQA